MIEIPESVLKNMGITPEQLEAANKRTAVDPALVRGVLAQVPPSWSLIQHSEHGAAFRRGYINVIVSVEHCDDHNDWIHVSASGFKSTPNSWFIPSWDDMKRVKHDFLQDKWAYVVFPSEKKYVNHNPYVLHLYARLDGANALPDFTHGLGTL